MLLYFVNYQYFEILLHNFTCLSRDKNAISHYYTCLSAILKHLDVPIVATILNFKTELIIIFQKQLHSP
jgi:hypothetical protein